MTFSQALGKLKRGNKVSRQDWYGKYMYIELVENCSVVSQEKIW